MPKVGYLTFIDRHALLGLVLVVAVLVETSMAHYFIVNGRAETGQRIQRLFRWLFPLLYGSGILTEFLWLASNGL